MAGTPSMKAENTITGLYPIRRRAIGVKIWVITVAAMNTPVVAPARALDPPSLITASGTTGSRREKLPKAAATATSTARKPGLFHMLGSCSISARVRALVSNLSQLSHRPQDAADRADDTDRPGDKHAHLGLSLACGPRTPDEQTGDDEQSVDLPPVAHIGLGGRR